MSLLLLFSDQVVNDTTDPVMSVLLETTPGGPFDNIADDLLGGTTTRGRQRELDRYQAGTCSLQLRNESRQYDPNHVTTIKPRRKLQVRATWAGTTYPLFTGTVDRWTQNYDGPNTATAGVDCTDGFKLLNLAQLASSAYAQEVLADNPAAWWRLGDSTTPYLDAIGTADLTVGTGKNAPAAGAEGLVSREPDGAVTFTALDSEQLTGPAGSAPAGAEYTVELIIQSPTPVGTTRSIAFWTDSAGLNDSQISFDGALGHLQWAGLDSVQVVANNTVRHVAVVQTSTQQLMYVDGTLLASQAGIGVSYAGGTFRLGATTTNNFGGVIDEVAVYNTALSAARIAAHAEAVATPWNNDTPGERVERVLDAAGWSETLRDIDDGASTLQSADLATSALEHLQKVAESELGNVYVTAGGILRFEGRESRVNQPSAGTFTDAHGTTPRISALQPEYGDDLLRNPVTVSRLEGVAQTAQDDGALDEYGPAAYTLDGLLIDDDDLSRSIAQLLVAEYAEPTQRIAGVTVYPWADPTTLFPQVLARELTDAITVAHTPQGVGAQNTQVSTIEGITHTFGPKSWETVWSLSPALGGETGFWQIGVAGHSEIGLTTRIFV